MNKAPNCPKPTPSRQRRRPLQGHGGAGAAGYGKLSGGSPGRGLGRRLGGLDRRRGWPAIFLTNEWIPRQPFWRRSPTTGIPYRGEKDGVRFVFEDGSRRWETVCRYAPQTVMIYGVYPFPVADKGRALHQANPGQRYPHKGRAIPFGGADRAAGQRGSVRRLQRPGIHHPGVGVQRRGDETLLDPNGGLRQTIRCIPTLRIQNINGKPRKRKEECSA